MTKNKKSRKTQKFLKEIKNNLCKIYAKTAIFTKIDVEMWITPRG